MVSGARPSCTSCTRELFEVYYNFASNSSLEISKNYPDAAEVLNLDCGVNFVSTSVSLKDSGGGRRGVGWMMMVVWTLALWMIL
jgi:hypothetical protein